MTTAREHLAALDARGDLVAVTDPVQWDGEALAVVEEALRANAPAVHLRATPGLVSLAGGTHTGPDMVVDRDRAPWARVAVGLGQSGDAPYGHVVERLAARDRRRPPTEPAAATLVDATLHDLGLPSLVPGGPPTVTLGLAGAGGSTGNREGTTWAPAVGVVAGPRHLSLRVPAAFAAAVVPGEPVTLSLGVPTAALAAALADWAADRPRGDTPALAAAIGSVPVAEGRGGAVPASSEVTLVGTAAATDPGDPGTGTRPAADGRPTTVGFGAAWEAACPSAPLGLTVDTVRLREEPTVPVVPLGAPLSDDVTLLGLVEAARLRRRLNGYWGVSPVEWVALPAETRLGVCLVASEVLYAGFEWQLANALFAFSDLFDKVVVLDADTPPANLGRAFDDLWVKAHPSHDWVFSESAAPAATAPAYRRDGTTGSRVYVDAAWDPRWDEEFIAPRVDFEASYPAEVRDRVLNGWAAFGFENAPPERR